MPGRQGEERLPRGRHRLTSEHVSESQRRRLMAAALTLFAECGFGLTSRQIAQRAHVSATTLYEHFDGVDGVLAAAFEQQAELLLACAGSASEWVGALDGFFAAEPVRPALFGHRAAVGSAALGAARELLLERLGATVPLSSRAGDGTLLAAAAVALLCGGAGEGEEIAAVIALLV